MIGNVLVLGAGSAGLIAAISLKIKIPQMTVRIVRSPEIGVIGVGEGTTPNFLAHLFDYLHIRRGPFFALAQPTFKLGIHFLWGPRGQFDYGFAQQLDAEWHDLPRPNGYYCDEDFKCVDLVTALMAHGKTALPQRDRAIPDLYPWHALHIENKKLVDTLEIVAREAGIEFIDAVVKGAVRGPAGISAVVLEDGRTLEADFFIDASGFRSELLGRAMETPFIRFDRALFCDRAVVGGWERTDERILPYTTAETMDAGWAWRIEHEKFINRGYVYSSAFISDDAAKAEFLGKNPKVPESARVVKFRSGRYERAWVDNVLAIGNSCGFVEPLEATALMVVCWQARTFVDLILHTGAFPTPTLCKLYNESWAETWDEIRDFLAIHYRFNTLLDTPFWRHCVEHTDVSGVDRLLEFYDENGPTGFCRYMLGNTGSQFGTDGFLAMLVGNRVPYRGRHTPSELEWRIWNNHRADMIALAKTGMDAESVLACIRNPEWRWHGDK